MSILTYNSSRQTHESFFFPNTIYLLVKSFPSHGEGYHRMEFCFLIPHFFNTSDLLLQKVPSPPIRLHLTGAQIEQSQEYL